MEFYFINTTSNLSSLTGFQFPTGWNSTAELELLQRAGKSFNSQRDGILRLYTSFEADSSYVSIPNGMEFYSNLGLEFGLKILVSIPNGMEFYPLKTRSSPRLRLVSIPNGMELYFISSVSSTFDL